MFPVSVIIPVYRDAEALARTLASSDLSGAEVIVSAPTMTTRCTRFGWLAPICGGLMRRAAARGR